VKIAIAGTTWKSVVSGVTNEETMKLTRRDLFVWGAGAAAGLAFTPVPWKLLDDTSIWSQNWPWIPQPTRGPVDVKQSFCTLCPRGCAVKIRMAGGWPVGVAGVSANPLTHGALCPLGFGAHQLNWHPKRLRAVRHNGVPSSWDAARLAFVKACTQGPVVIIDGYPGRAASHVFETFTEKRGAYVIALNPETRALSPYERWTGVPATVLGYDLENAKMIVSFGAPLLDGWGIPGRFTRMWAERAAGVRDPELRLIDIEDSLSHTAAKAWKWVSAKTGSEVALAAAVARILIEERLVAAQGPVPRLTLAGASDQTGLTIDAMRDLARMIAAKPPAVVIGNDENPGVAGLNVVLGAVGARGGIVRRSKRSKSYASTDALLANAGAVLVDSSVPWDVVPKTDAECFRFAAWDGGSGRADWLLPAPGFLEELTDVPAAPTSGFETYGVAAQLTKPIHEVQSASQFLAGIDPALPTPEQLIHARCADLFKSRAGRVYAKEVRPVASLESAQKLEEQLSAGAIWIGDPPAPGGLKCELKEWPQGISTEPSRDWSATWPVPVLPPLATKLYRESALREEPDRRTA
jgi:hypothetical protein